MFEPGFVYLYVKCFGVEGSDATKFTSTSKDFLVLSRLLRSQDKESRWADATYLAARLECQGTGRDPGLLR